MADPIASPERAPETVVARLRPHERALAFPSLLLILDALAVGLGLGWIDGGPDLPVWLSADVLRIALLVVVAAIAILGFLVPLLRYLTRSVTITTRRVVIRSGVLLHSREELMHASGYRVTLRRGPFQLLFRSGDLVLEPGGDHRIRIRDVPQARLVQAALIELVDEATRGRWPVPFTSTDG